MRFKIFGITDKGVLLDKNEDRILIDKKVYGGGEISAVISAPMITAVCDGVGGEKGGEIAAAVCLHELSRVNYSSLTDIEKVIMDIHKTVLETAALGGAYSNMQTTLCALLLDEKNNALCVNVGDSRLYRYAGGAATLMSTDHTLVKYLYDMGEISAEEMKTSPDRNIIISSIGGENQPPKIDVAPIKEPLGSLEGDTVIICTDGITDHVGKTEIEVCMGLDITFEEKIDAIYRLALSRGSSDNLSIIGITAADEAKGDQL